MKIGIPEDGKVDFLPPRKEKPIVVYGTSMPQGACASRPGMAWTNILGRKLDCPIVNLGFSGNGRLEPEVLEFVTEVDAAIYVLDCLPNLSPKEKRSEKVIKKRLHNSIQHIRNKRPKAKILITQHAGYSDCEVDSFLKKIYQTLNLWTSEVFKELQRNEVKTFLYFQKAKSIFPMMLLLMAPTQPIWR